MYIPRHFEVTQMDEIHSFIEAHAFGQLISTVDGRLFSSHIPFLLSEDRTRLFGHVAKQNPQWRELHGQQALVTIEGPHGYVSPSWYNTPGVPTWNYQAVHIYGVCSVISDAEKLASLIEKLVEANESGFDSPWRAVYEPKMLSAIVGFEIKISDFQCKYKLSQNRPREDQLRVVEALEASGANQLAQAMRDSSK